jgi:hypothetical protein
MAKGRLSGREKVIGKLLSLSKNHTILLLQVIK